MSIGKRLCEERKRLKLNQAKFGEIGGVTKTSQFNYEAGERSPNIEYWQAIAAAGADTHYILTGEIKQQQLLSALNESTKKVASLPLVNECKAAIAQLLVGLLTDKMDLITDALDIIRSDYVGLGKAQDTAEASQDNLTPSEKDLLAAYRQASDADRTVIARVAQLAEETAKDEPEPSS